MKKLHNLLTTPNRNSKHSQEVGLPSFQRAGIEVGRWLTHLAEPVLGLLQTTTVPPVPSTTAEEVTVGVKVEEQPNKRHTFTTLDALRGVAAIEVVIFHIPLAFGGAWFQHGYLAVDFFFMLSGFVLTYAYQGKLDRGWPTGAFLKTRIMRLYPLYLLGLLVGALHTIPMHQAGRQNFGFGIFFTVLAIGLCLLPMPAGFHADGIAMYPFNIPAWSLFYEIAINVVHAIFLRRRKRKVLLGVIGVSGTLLLFVVMRLGSIDVGATRLQLFQGLVRVMFPYTMGIVIFKVWRAREWQTGFPPWLSSLLLLGAFALRIPSRFASVYDFLTILVIFPIIILGSASSQPSPRFLGPSVMLGRASYAIYILHAPVLSLLEQGWDRVRSHGVDQDAPWVGFVFLLVIAAVALAVDRFYDLPVRTFLRRRFLGVGGSN